MLILAGCEEYQFDDQGDWKENIVLNSNVDFQSESTPPDYGPFSKTSNPSKRLDLKNTLSIEILKRE